MYITVVSVILPVSLVAIGAAAAPTIPFRDFYANLQKTDRSANSHAIMPLTRRLGSSFKRRRDLQAIGLTGYAKLSASGLGGNFLADVTIGDQTFPLIVDTGSSDTWVPSSKVQCVDKNRTDVDRSNCAFGPLYHDAAALTPIPGIFMNQTYVSGEFMTGPMYLEQVTLGGLTIDQTQVGIVDTAFWEGDGVNSGIVGLSSPATTSAESSANGSFVVYNPVLVNMFNAELALPFFSLALDKVDSGPAGYLAIGGLPPVSFDEFTTVPIEQPFSKFTDYLVNVTGFSYRGSTNISSAQNQLMIVDSGTSTMVVPTALAKEINSLFNPPAFYNETLGAIQVDCNAEVPTVYVHIGDGTFAINPATQIFEEEQGICSSGWEDGGEPDPEDPSFFLGDVFMTNVVSVFDLGSLEMSFAARTDVSSANDASYDY